MASSDAARKEEVDVVIISSGLEALAVACRLPKELLKGTVVVDPSGEWLGAWREWARRLDVRHLRTPVTLHPGADPAGLRAFAERRARAAGDELAPAVPGFAQLPAAALMRDYCLQKLARGAPAVIRDAVAGVEPLAGEEGAAPRRGGVRVALASGRALRARAVVHCGGGGPGGGPLPPVVPAWARPHWARRAGSGLAAAAEVDLPAAAARLPGRRVAVVGGGMTAAALAAGAAERGARVTLVHRRRLREQAFDVDVGWWGTKLLAPFWADARPEARAAAARAARRAATVHPPLWRRLHTAAAGAAAGALAVVEDAEVAAAERAPGGGWALALRGAGLTPPLDAPSAFGPPPPPPAARFDAGAEASNPHFKAPLLVDEVWVACGDAYDASADAALGPLLAAAPAPLAGGYPWVHAPTGAWPGAPVFLVGRAAALGAGPAARDLGGAAAGARRAAAALARLGYAGAPPWADAAAALRAALAPQRVDAALPAAPPPEAPPPEADGAAWRPPRRRVAGVPDGGLDLSDLFAAAPPGLPRRDVRTYTVVDDGFRLRVAAPLPEAVAPDRVRARFTATSVEAWAVGAAGAYRLAVSPTYGRLVPARCAARAAAGGRRLALDLHKESDAEWAFLRGAAV